MKGAIQMTSKHNRQRVKDTSGLLAVESKPESMAGASPHQRSENRDCVKVAENTYTCSTAVARHFINLVRLES